MRGAGSATVFACALAGGYACSRGPDEFECTPGSSGCRCVDGDCRDGTTCISDLCVDLVGEEGYYDGGYYGDSGFDPSTSTGDASTGDATTGPAIPTCDPGDAGRDALVPVPVEAWSLARDGGAMGEDRFVDVTEVEGGDIVAVGWIAIAPGTSAAVVVAFAPDGPELWAQTLASDASAQATAVAPVGAGELVVVGREGSGASAGGWVRRLDAQGGELWRIDLGVGVLPAAIDAIDDDVVVVGGATSAAGDRDAFVQRLVGADGATVWNEPYAGPAGLDDFATAVAVGFGGDLVVAGTSEARVDIARYGGDGALVWRTWGVGCDATSSFGRAVALEGGVADMFAGRIWVAGGIIDAGGETLAFVQPYNAVGWTLGEPSLTGMNAQANGVAVHPLEIAIAVGEVGVTGNGRDVFLRGVDVWNSDTWTITRDGGMQTDDRAAALAIASDGTIVVVGDTLVRGQDLDGWIAAWQP